MNVKKMNEKVIPVYQWTSAKRSNRRRALPSFEVSSYPLKTNVIAMKEHSSSSIIDHINKWSSNFEEVDPLLRFEQMKLEEDINPLDVDIIEGTNYLKAWSDRRTSILSKYTTGEKLTIVSSYLPGGEKALIRQVSNLNEKVKHRLEQLDDFDESSVRKTMGLSQQEFVTKINMLNDEIKKAWESEQRVKAFKIGIQCSKLLSDISVMQFYPSKFILITDTLDTFGNLVFNRLKDKSFGNNNLVNVHNIDPRAVPESAKETCQNWMYKMASIRELLPRLYMEMALLKCYVFISKDEIKPAIARITTMIRGIGNPLVAAYLRVYLCHNACKLLSEDSEEYFYSNLKEFLEEYQQIFLVSMRKKYETQLLTQDKYLNLYTPALDWLLFGTLHSNKCKDDLLDNFLQRCERIENSELFLCCIVSAFDSPTIIKKVAKILEMVHNNADKMVMMNEVLTPLGEHLCKTDNYRQVASESLVQTWWKIASGMKSTHHFLQVLEPWLQFACTHLSTQHVNIILRGTIRYMVKCGKPADDFSGNFLFVIKRMLKSIPDVEEVFLMDAFMPLLELVQTSSARTMLAKTVLSIFFSRYNSVHIEDPIVISSLMRLCCILHDSINAVTVEDESKICGELINKFIQAVTYHDNLERQLNFYVECRSSFIKLDAVLIALVHAVNALAARASPARSKWLQRACAAYCYVTVPSLHCSLTKSQLYLLSGQVALLNNCIGQAEANFKAVIGLMQDIPEYILEDGQKKPTHVRAAGIYADLLSTLLVVPDNVDSNCTAYILSGFLKSMDRIHWKKTEPLYYTTLLRALDLIGEMSQENYAHHIESVLSNDKLYGCDSEFISVLETYATKICQELLAVLKELALKCDTKKQYDLALEFFWRVARRGELKERPMKSLAGKLWMMAFKINDSNNNLHKSILLSLQNDNNPNVRYFYEKMQELIANPKTVIEFHHN